MQYKDKRVIEFMSQRIEAKRAIMGEDSTYNQRTLKGIDEHQRRKANIEGSEAPRPDLIVKLPEVVVKSFYPQKQR